MPRTTWVESAVTPSARAFTHEDFRRARSRTRRRPCISGELFVVTLTDTASPPAGDNYNESGTFTFTGGTVKVRRSKWLGHRDRKLHEQLARSRQQRAARARPDDLVPEARLTATQGGLGRPVRRGLRRDHRPRPPRSRPASSEQLPLDATVHWATPKGTGRVRRYTRAYGGSSRDTIAAFKHVLDRAGVPATVRLTRGREIAAACGQLAADPRPRISA